MLYRVTLTGADDSVEPAELFKVWEDYPFVEWGVLIGSQSGVPRMQSRSWIDGIAELFGRIDDCDMAMSLHLCGKHLRAVLAGRFEVDGEPDFPLHIFDRVQLNFHGNAMTAEQQDGVLYAMNTGAALDLTPIIQLDAVNDHILSRFPAKRAEGLFDQSHGAGILPHNWNRPIEGYVCGYAGGLGPENIAAELPKIIEQSNGAMFWIDMETKLFSDSGRQFDLHKCRAVLEHCSEFIRGIPGGVRPDGQPSPVI